MKKLTIDLIKELWSKTYDTEGKPDWSHILPYYDNSIFFKDPIQEIHGLDEFKAMTQRLTNRSSDLRMNIVNVSMDGSIVFIEWEMTLSFKKYPSSVLCGTSRLYLNREGKIVEQRDYYDLWGTILGNIPQLGGAYGRFMKRKFG